MPMKSVDVSVRPSRRRLFFALWPDPATRLKLASLLHALPAGQGRDMRAENLHVTLFFLGDCEPDLLPCFERAGAAVTGAPFELVLDELGVFERAHVLWAGTRNPPEALLILHEALAVELEVLCGVTRDTRPYAPHLTLRRHATQRVDWPPSIPPVTWPVDALTLVESFHEADGVVYRPIRQWPLRKKDETAIDRV